MANTVEVDVVVLHVTEDAILCCDASNWAGSPDDVGEDDKVWIPKSQIDEDDDAGEITAESVAGEIGVLVIPEWLAVDKGLV